MLFKNDIFMLNDVRYRLLEANASQNKGWIINLADPIAWPEEMPWRSLVQLSPEPATELDFREPSESSKSRRDAAVERITPLLQMVPDILYPRLRNSAVKDRAVKVGCSERTIHKDLRRYWKGGQTPDALLADYHYSGHRHIKDGDSSPAELTAGRGRLPVADRPIYQVSLTDTANMKYFIEEVYFKDKRISMRAAHQQMLNTRYTVLDGNGKAHIRPLGSRPSIRQFRHYFHANYSPEQKIRAREGDKDFERDHRAKLGTVFADCLGVGHYYEIDATIVNLYGVSTESVKLIVGKPTLFLIIDRKSRLIVGFYLGYENPSWAGAMEAIRSLSADKRELCKRFGVEYCQEDWPAHEVFPKEFLADRGEMAASASNQVCDELQVTVTNLPGCRPDWKPLVECGFKLLHEAIKDEAPGFDPVANATRRRGKHYDKDACLNLREIGKIILEAIIAHNRRAMPNYDLSTEELVAGVEPTPIALWNHNIVERAGLLTRFPEQRVRYALLPKDEAAVTEMGVCFKGCYYTCPEAISKGWFVKARKNRFKVSVSYESRLVDHIYVHDLLTGTQPYLASLTTRSEKYAGLSFSEVKVFEDMRKRALPSIDEQRAQVAMEFHDQVDPVVEAAKEKLRKAGKVSRSSRRADTKPDRMDERRAERQDIASLAPQSHQGPAIDPTCSNIVSLPSRNPAGQPTDGEGSTAVGTTNMQQKLQEARRRMLNGY